MNTQVVAQLGMSDATDYRYWVEQGWKGILFTLLAACIIFAIYKGKVGIASLGPSDAGIRELLGVRLWRIGPGPHLDIDGFWKVRRTSVARIEVKFGEEFPLKGITWQYSVSVFLKLGDTRDALIAQIYTAQDLNRENMENSAAEEQTTTILTRQARVLMESGASANRVEKKLMKRSQAIRAQYGYDIEEVFVLKRVKRPESEIAAAIRSASPGPGIVAAATSSTKRPELEVLEGGSANQAEAAQ